MPILNRSRSHRYAALASIGLAALLVPAPNPLIAADFIRGDVNGDGEVSISDAYSIIAWLYFPDGELRCLASADTDDNGSIDLSDISRIFLHVVLGSETPAMPYPQPGFDPTGEPDEAASSCDSYGGGSPIQDPQAELLILDAVAFGGSDRLAQITVGLSSSVRLAGFQGTILSADGILGPEKPSAVNLSIDYNQRFLDAGVRDGALHFGFLAGSVSPKGGWIPPGTGVEVIRIHACIAPGTRTGAYPLALAAGELIDQATGQAIQPAPTGANLRVLSDVRSDAACEPSAPKDPPPQFHVVYKAGGATGAPGSAIRIPFTIRSSVEVQGYSFSADFDERILQATSIEDIFGEPREEGRGFRLLEINNRDDNPGSLGIDEGFLIGGVVFSYFEKIVLPPDRDNRVLDFHFLINPETTAASTEVRFLDGGRGRGQPVRNRITALSKNFTPELANSFIFLDSFVKVIDQIAVFTRGDSNRDGLVDISDAQHTLSYLFLGGEAIFCPDAADSNDDGQIDIADPIHTLQVLFLDIGRLAPPYPYAGLDETPDDLEECGILP